MSCQAYELGKDITSQNRGSKMKRKVMPYQAHEPGKDITSKSAKWKSKK